MPRIDAAFLQNAQEHCNGGLGWCEKHDIERQALVDHARALLVAAATEDFGMASYGIGMFKLGYEVQRQQHSPCLVCGWTDSHPTSCPYFEKGSDIS